jgi:hypothetical protein
MSEHTKEREEFSTWIAGRVGMSAEHFLVQMLVTKMYEEDDDTLAAWQHRQQRITALEADYNALRDKHGLLPVTKVDQELFVANVTCRQQAKMIEALEAQISKSEARNAELRKYARHDPLCGRIGGYPDGCTCGLDKALGQEVK